MLVAAMFEELVTADKKSFRSKGDIPDLQLQIPTL